MSVTTEHLLFLTIQETATLFRVEPRTIRKWIAAGRLPAKRITGSRGLLIPREAAWNLLEDVPISMSPASASVSDLNPQTEADSGIIRRMHTPEGRARALAALDSLLEGDEEEHRHAWEHLQKTSRKAACNFESGISKRVKFMRKDPTPRDSASACNHFGLRTP